VGSFDPILGTNPICFGFPDEEPLVIDFATSERVWGEIRQASLEGRPMPKGAFYDKDGLDAINPEDVHSVKAFGGHKGFGLCLAIELLAGALLPGKVGTAVDTQYDLGALFVAISPHAFGTAGSLPQGIHALREQVHQAKKLPGVSDEPHISGERSRARRSEWIERGLVPVHLETLKRLTEMSVSSKGGIESTASMD
jgi:LDH2 family malate/lactate/ureidoglycolate dehydrogenase